MPVPYSSSLSGCLPVLLFYVATGSRGRLLYFVCFWWCLSCCPSISNLDCFQFVKEKLGDSGGHSRQRGSFYKWYLVGSCYKWWTTATGGGDTLAASNTMPIPTTARATCITTIATQWLGHSTVFCPINVFYLFSNVYRLFSGSQKLVFCSFQMWNTLYFFLYFSWNSASNFKHV